MRVLLCQQVCIYKNLCVFGFGGCEELQCVTSEVFGDYGALSKCTVHCVCSKKVREGHSSSDKAVVPLQS